MWRQGEQLVQVRAPSGSVAHLQLPMAGTSRPASSATTLTSRTELFFASTTWPHYLPTAVARSFFRAYSCATRSKSRRRHQPVELRCYDLVPVVSRVLVRDETAFVRVDEAKIEVEVTVEQAVAQLFGPLGVGDSSGDGPLYQVERDKPF